MNFKNLILILTILLSFKVFSQVDVEILSLQYTNNGQPTVGAVDCGEIDLKSSSSTSINLGISLSKPSNQVTGSGTKIYIYSKMSSSVNRKKEWESGSISESSWNQPTDGGDKTFSTSATFQIEADDFEANGGFLYATYESSSETEYNSCNYNIVKDEVPGFSISPTNETVSCNNTTPKTFSVIPENIPAGSNVVYQWSIGNGWFYEGNVVSNFTTTTATIQLTPFNFPPSNVRVSPVLDGVSYPELTSNVSLGSFNPGFPIDGSANLCDTGLYTIIGLPNDITILSASTSNASVATASLTNNQITLSKVSDGSVTLSVVLENSCSQTATITKAIQVGIPSSVFNAEVTGDTVICGTQNYTYSLNVSHPCVNQVVWELSGNLNLVSQSSSAITVAQDLSNTEAAGFIKATIPGTSFESTKGVWVGLPLANALSINKVGAYNFYTGRWTKLRANYGPLAYVSNQEPQTITYEWIVPSSYVRNFTDTAFKDVRPFSTGQLNIGVKAENECGCSAYKYQLFEVIQEDGGGYTGPGLTPVN